ncbi:hypothetical protein [Halopiger goleimassiliensis]|uniref:hypothetical protein n=1 Tax=Halopiger goleimassiliensis TaxID=1293048 RepID=UPI000B2C09CA|nr:hypothetical protein [Halopiger goleimassiliensis]
MAAGEVGNGVLYLIVGVIAAALAWQLRGRTDRPRRRGDLDPDVLLLTAIVLVRWRPD